MKFETFESPSGEYLIERSFALCLRLWGTNNSGVAEQLSLQRALDPKDDENGPAGLYVERGQQEYACYGGVELCSFEGNVVAITMDAEGAFELGGIKTWRFYLPARSHTELPSVLAHLFRGCDGLMVNNK